MGYYAETVYTRINVKKDKLSIIKERSKFADWNVDFTDAHSILTGLGYEPEYDADGNLEGLPYPDSSFDLRRHAQVLVLLEGLVDEGDHFEWLGSEGDDNRWINIHKNGKWETHDGYVEVKYSSDVWGTKPTEKQYIRCSKCSCTELQHEEVS
tara:strand:+ start:562 stop:1020 length:459 start_codon:yes stop_codon:yes gene_type:complete